MKHEWRKHEKEIHGTKKVTKVIDVPKFMYYTIEGVGNPNDELFQKKIEALYTVSYGIRMSKRQGLNLEGYAEYTVYPLEGEWSLTKKGIQKKLKGELVLDNLKYKIMIRQPDFLEEKDALDNIERSLLKKDNPELMNVKYEEIQEGLSVQMIHVGPFANENETFRIMEDYCKQNNLKRISKDHREIYLSDPRKSKPENLKTILRFKVKKSDVTLYATTKC